LKQLVKSDHNEFERESKALMRFNGFGNAHLVTLLMTWTMEGRYNLLFPLAHCDLDEYWEQNPDPIRDPSTVRWMLKQIVGIASALHAIHEPPSNSIVPTAERQYGRHGDLKPENILWYDSPVDPKGILVVADLGLSQLNSKRSRSMESNEQVAVTPRYKPPECDIVGAKVSRSYDIWTFGCVLLEWIIWALEGQRAREEFLYSLRSPYPNGSHCDMFFDLMPLYDNKYRAVIKPQVIEVSFRQKCRKTSVLTAL
jgi:serine/threonine protein kinase